MSKSMVDTSKEVHFQSLLRKFGTPVKTISGVIASTPCRDQHVQTVDQTFNSISQKLLTGTRTARADIANTRHLEEQEMSVLVRETPEHLWCSPNLCNVENYRAECDSK